MWERLFLPPLLASATSYVLTKNVKGLKKKLVAFWAMWSVIGCSVHALLSLPPELLPAYPLLAASTGAFMYGKVRELEDKRLASRG